MIPLCYEDIQIVRESAFVSQISEVQGRPQSIDLPLLCFGLLTGGADSHQSVFNFPERDEDRLLVLGQSLPGVGFSRALVKP